MRTLAEIIPLRTSECRESADAVAQIAAGENDIEPRAAVHVRSCLRCQAEVAAYRRILRTMQSMRHDMVPPPPGGLTDVVRALQEAADGGAQAMSWGTVAAYVGGLTAAGAAGVLVWYTRRRPWLPHAG